MNNIDKTPAFLRPLYPFRAVGDALDVTRLDDITYIKMEGVLYELKCPNPDCVMNIRTQGRNLKNLYDHIKEVSGCPVCKLQFGINDDKGYFFKEGEIKHDILKNNGQWDGFIVKRVIYVSDEIFENYAIKLFHKHKNELSRQESDLICEEYYKDNNN